MTTKMMKGPQPLSSKERLGGQEQFTLERGRLQVISLLYISI